MRLAITSIIFLIIALSIQLLIPYFYGGKIDLALIIVIYVALISGSTLSLIFAFFAGLLTDSIASSVSPVPINSEFVFRSIGTVIHTSSDSIGYIGTYLFGSTVLVYVIIAYLISLFNKKLYLDNVFTMIFLPFIATIGKTIIMLIIIFVSRIFFKGEGIDISNYLISSTIELGMNTLFSPLIYILLNLITGNKKRSI